MNKLKQRSNHTVGLARYRSTLARISIGITIFTAAISPCLSIAQSGNADALLCLHNEICITSSNAVGLQPLDMPDSQGRTIFARHTREPAQHHAVATQYFLQIVPVRRETNDRRLWLDLAQRIRDQHSSVLPHPQRPVRYSINNLPDSYGRYQRFSWLTTNGEAQALYHLLKLKQQRYWVIATAVAPHQIGEFSQEILQLFSAIVPAPSQAKPSVR